MANIHATDTITVVEGYDAMRIFLEICRRHGEAADIALIIGGLKWADGAPVDPAMWEDWLAAVQVSTQAGGGEFAFAPVLCATGPGHCWLTRRAGLF
jgi:hypothetical protein